MKPLKYTETKQINGRERRTIEISLADECQNGICNFQVETKTEKLVFGYWQRCYCGEKQRNAERKTFKNLIAEV